MNDFPGRLLYEIAALAVVVLILCLGFALMLTGIIMFVEAVR